MADEEAEWTAEDWRELRATASKLLEGLEDLSGRLARVENRLAWGRTPRPQQPKRAG